MKDNSVLAKTIKETETELIALLRKKLAATTAALHAAEMREELIRQDLNKRECVFRKLREEKVRAKRELRKKEAAALAERARLKQASDKEQLVVYLDAMVDIDRPQVKGQDAINIVRSIKSFIQTVAAEIEGLGQ